jgi:hypothetical protein
MLLETNGGSIELGKIDCLMMLIGATESTGHVLWQHLYTLRTCTSQPSVSLATLKSDLAVVDTIFNLF